MTANANKNQPPLQLAFLNIFAVYSFLLGMQRIKISRYDVTSGGK